MRGLGLSPARAGVILMAAPLAISISSPLSGWLSDHLGTRWLCAGGLAVGCGSLFCMSRLHAGSDPTSLAAAMFALGLGMGAFQSPNNSAIMGAVPVEVLGVVGGILASVRNLGLAIGIAMAGAIFTWRASCRLDLELSGTVMDSAAPEILFAGFSETFLIAMAICFVGVVTTVIRGESRQPGPGR